MLAIGGNDSHATVALKTARSTVKNNQYYTQQGSKSGFYNLIVDNVQRGPSLSSRTRSTGLRMFPWLPSFLNASGRTQNQWIVQSSSRCCRSATFTLASHVQSQNRAAHPLTAKYEKVVISFCRSAKWSLLLASCKAQAKLHPLSIKT